MPMMKMGVTFERPTTQTYRGWMEIVYDMLCGLEQGPLNSFRLMYKTRLSSGVARNYIVYCLDRGLIASIYPPRTSIATPEYALTEKGKQLIRNFEPLAEFFNLK